MFKTLRYFLSVIIFLFSILLSGCFSGGDVPQASGDRVPPIISILGVDTPHINAANEISGNIVIRVQAKDNVGIAKVDIQFKNGSGEIQKTISATSPTTGNVQDGVYEITYNTVDLLNGTYTITAVAQDEKGFRTPANYASVLKIMNNGPSIEIGGQDLQDGSIGNFPGAQDVKVAIPAGYDGIVYTLNGTIPTMGPPINSFNIPRPGTCPISQACEVTIHIEKSSILKVRAYKWNSETNQYEYSGTTTVTVIIEGTVMTPIVDVDGNGNGSGTYDSGDLDGEGYLNIKVTIPKDAQGIVYTKNNVEPNIYKSGSDYVIRDYVITCDKRTNDANLNGFSGYSYSASLNPTGVTCSNNTDVVIRLKASATLKIKAYKWNGSSFDFSDTTTVEIIIEGTTPTPEITIPTPDNPGTGTYTGPVTITVVIPDGATGIIYTNNGSTPTMGNEGNGGSIPVNGTVVTGNPGNTVTIVVDSSAEITIIGYTDTGNGYQYSEGSETVIIITGTVFVPSFNPAPGHYTTVQQINLSSSNAETIRYTLGDGSQAAPANCSSGILYTGAIRVETRKTIKAIGCASGLTQSMASVGTFNVAAPSVESISITSAPGVNAATGTYTQAQTFSFTTNTTGVSIYYTTNGSEPACGSGTVGSSVVVSVGSYPNANTKTIKAIACKDGWISSAIKSETVNIYNQLAAPTFDGTGDQPGTYTASTKPANIKLVSAQSGVEIHYTTNGNAPGCNDTLYSTPIALTGSSTIKAVACKDNWAVSNALSGTYTITGTLTTPTFSPEGGVTFHSAPSVSISSDAGTTTYYTTNGVDPDCSGSGGAAYSSALTVSASQEIKAIACKASYDPSAISSSVYYISLAAPANLTVSQSTSTSQIALTWDNVTGADKYYVYRSLSSDGTYTKVGESATNSYSDSGVEVGLVYYYKVTTVEVFNSVNVEGVATSVKSGWLKLAAPANLAAGQGVNTSQVTLSWDAVSGAESYVIYKNSTQLATVTAPTVSYNDSAVTAGTAYSYSVKALRSSSAASESTESSVVSGWLKLTKPGSVSATDGTYTDKVVVSWSSVSGAQNYTLYRNGSQLASGVSATSYNDTSVSNAQTYTYTVKAVRTGTAASESLISDTDTGYKKLSAPTGVSASDGSSTSAVAVSWSAVTGANQYQVYRDEVALTTVTVTSYSDTSAVAGQTYSYTVKALNTADSKYSSVSSAVDSGYRQLSAPATITVSPKNAAADSITVAWTASGTYDKAVICRAMEDVAEKYTCDKYQYGTNPTSFEDESALSNITYYYKVKVLNTVTGAESAVSSVSDYGKRIGDFNTLGTTGFGGGSSGVRYTSIMFYQGVPYVAYKDQADSKIYAKYFDWKENSWKELGTSALVGSNAQAYPMTTIYVHDESHIYVAYTNSDDKVVVKTFTGGSWSDLGSLNATADYNYSFLTMHADTSGNPYIAYRDSSDKIMVWTYQSSVWSKVGGADTTAGVVGSGSSSTGGSYLALYVSGTTPYVVYMESGNVFKCKYLAGSTWTDFGDTIPATYSYGSYPYPKLFVDGSTVYIAYNDGRDMYVKTGTGSTWSNVGGGKAVSSAASNLSRNAMKVIDGRIYIGYQSGSTGYIKMYDGSSWDFVGGNNSPNFDNGIIGSLPSLEQNSYISLDFAYGSVFAAFTDADQSGKISVRY